MKSKSPLSRPEQESVAYDRAEIAEWRVALSDRTVAGLEKLGNLAVNHWLALLNSFSILLLLGTFLTPVLELWNLTALSRPLYWFYSWLCLQRPTHSFFLAGYQMGMEVRMVAISAGLVVAGFLYTSQEGRRLSYRFCTWRNYLLLSLPMLADVLSQTFNLRGSDWYWRGPTGFLFGVASVWFFYFRFDKLARRYKNRKLQEI